jgi:hypothetical protein
MKRFVIVVATLFAWSAPAVAHIQLDDPPARITDQKTGPCGAAGSVRGDVVTTFEAGQTIEVKWRETINHPGHYRISFDADGQDDFVDPAGFDDFDSAPSVMLDNIGDANGGEYTQSITLPNEPCENCTLQLVQVMTDKAPYGDGNDLYYQCADIRIVAGPADMPDAGSSGEPDAGTNDGGATGNNGGTTSGNGDTTPSNPGGGAIDDGYVDDGMSGEDDPACSTAAGAAIWPSIMLLAFVAIRRRQRSRIR